ncbi:MAG: sialate O-acetylesterase, partial [Marinoscillum sp.]
MRSALFFFLYFAVHLATLAQLQLPRLFADHMVFQRNQPTKLWGWSTAGQTVNIDFDNESISVKADAAGYFEAFLKPRAAGGPYEMTVSGDTTYHYKDILIGDVWIAGGQSNMEW